MSDLEVKSTYEEFIEDGEQKELLDKEYEELLESESKKRDSNDDIWLEYNLSSRTHYALEVTHYLPLPAEPRRV